MPNVQLNPAYIVQTGTEGQYITGFSLHQRAGDLGSSLFSHLQHLDEHGGDPKK